MKHRKYSKRQKNQDTQTFLKNAQQSNRTQNQEDTKYNKITGNQNEVKKEIAKQTTKHFIHFIAFALFGLLVSKALIDTNNEGLAKILNDLIENLEFVIWFGLMLLPLYFLQFFDTSEFLGYFFEPINDYIAFCLKILATAFGVLLAGLLFLKRCDFINSILILFLFHVL